MVNPKLKIKSAKERIYRGVKVPQEILDQNRELYLNRKESIYRLWEDFGPLDDEHRVEALEFLDAFYAVLEDDKQFSKSIIQRLRNIEKLDQLIGKRMKEAEQ